MNILKYDYVTMCCHCTKNISHWSRLECGQKQGSGWYFDQNFYSYYQWDKSDLRGAGLSCVTVVPTPLPTSTPPVETFHLAFLAKKMSGTHSCLCQYRKLPGLCSLLDCVAVCLWAPSFHICEMKTMFTQLLRGLILCRWKVQCCQILWLCSNIYASGAKAT